MLRQQKVIVNNIIHRRIISEEQLFLIIKYSSNAIKTDFFDDLTDLLGLPEIKKLENKYGIK